MNSSESLHFSLLQMDLFVIDLELLCICCKNFTFEKLTHPLEIALQWLEVRFSPSVKIFNLDLFSYIILV